MELCEKVVEVRMISDGDVVVVVVCGEAVHRLTCVEIVSLIVLFTTAELVYNICVRHMCCSVCVMCYAVCVNYVQMSLFLCNCYVLYNLLHFVVPFLWQDVEKQD